MIIPLEHFREKELPKAGISLGLRHKAQKFIGVAEEGFFDAVLELLPAQELDAVGFEGRPKRLVLFQLLLDGTNNPIRLFKGNPVIFVQLLNDEFDFFLFSLAAPVSII